MTGAPPEIRAGMMTSIMIFLFIIILTGSGAQLSLRLAGSDRRGRKFTNKAGITAGDLARQGLNPLLYLL